MLVTSRSFGSGDLDPAAELRAAGFDVVRGDPFVDEATTTVDELLARADVITLHCPGGDAPLIDESALKKLRRGAAEPAGASPLLRAPRVTITPHVSAQTTQAIDRMGAESAAEVLRVLRGEPARNPVTA